MIYNLHKVSHIAEYHTMNDKIKNISSALSFYLTQCMKLVYEL